MRVVDLTLIMPESENGQPTALTEERLIRPVAGAPYVARVHHFRHTGMVGTYIDFPGHIVATDDGIDAATCPLARLYRVPAVVIPLDRGDGSGPVSAADLEAAAGGTPAGCGALVVNALGARRFDQIAMRSVFLDASALDWIVGTGIHLLVSDIYESRALHGVFGRLFAAGISTVCCPVNLHELTATHVLLTALPARCTGVRQLPCRLLAEMMET